MSERVVSRGLRIVVSDGVVRVSDVSPVGTPFRTNTAGFCSESWTRGAFTPFLIVVLNTDRVRLFARVVRMSVRTAVATGTVNVRWLSPASNEIAALAGTNGRKAIVGVLRYTPLTTVGVGVVKVICPRDAERSPTIGYATGTEKEICAV